MATMPEAMLTMIWGMQKGETRVGPFSFILRTSASVVAMPPTPEETMQPQR